MFQDWTPVGWNKQGTKQKNETKNKKCIKMTQKSQHKIKQDAKISQK